MSTEDLDRYDEFSGEASEDEDDYDTSTCVFSSGQFATESNLPACFDYIQSALAAHGMNGAISPEGGNKSLADACNVIYSLLQRLQQQVEQTERAEDQIARLSHSLKMAKQANSNLQDTIEDREREIGSLRNRMTAATNDKLASDNKLASDRRELQRKCVDLESRSKRMQTELKRKEAELSKANAKLRELLESKGNNARHLRQLSTALSLHSRTTSMSSVRSERSDASGDGIGASAAATESRIQTLKETYETKYKELYAKHSDLQTAYSRLQDTYKNMLFQQLRSGAKENIRYTAGDDSGEE